MIKPCITKILSICLILLFAQTVLAAKPTEVKSVRIWPSPESTRVVFDVSGEIQYKIMTLTDPDRVVVDFNDAKVLAKITSLDLKDTPIKKIRVGRHGPLKYRVVFETKKPVHPNSFQLKPNERYGHRLVLDLELFEKQAILALFDLDTAGSSSAKSSAKTQTTATAKPVSKLSTKPKPQDFIIAIDCGHGGEDPGAIGPRGTKEKDVVLAIGRQLKTLINRQKGYRAFLTRNGDYYIGLRERVDRARKRNADLFVSIHADAFTSPKAKGASVFMLSERGATSTAAKWLAEKENRSDLVGGVKLADKGNVLAKVLLDLSQSASEESSLEAAKHVLNSIGRVSVLHKPHVERAGFAVLKAPDMPSILIETGFISNPGTERLLRSKGHQSKLAKSILQGVNRYFQGKPRRATRMIAKSKPSAKSIKYKVKKGDSLSRIAARHGVHMHTLKKINRLRSNTVRLGQILVIPTS